jgi:imidazolonepropionase-like amidohydrolase
MRDESLVERVIRATNHCRTTLLAGYTTYRDLGTEGLSDADTNVRDSINQGLMPGPRLFVATEAIASSGGVRMPPIADVADGIDGVRAAVRRRIGAGADVVKVYADYRKRTLWFPLSQWQGAP